MPAGWAMERVFPQSLLLFDPDSSQTRERGPAGQRRDKAKDDHRILCVACRAPITHRDQCIAVSGAHTHTCRNPHGFVFVIGCFRAAAGCSTEAAETAEHSWFAAYRWSIAHCAQCDRHLGWRFNASGDRFYGLILDRLTESALPAS